ncbi:Gfo/Idh/MocA family protein [Streptomyces sp. MA5143a]|uniref:Gfo/Idh/MocA family protein n=1 Tax=Streptomyces sp. MA5143a TaxID=2083010 RepID=UPI000D1C11CF|nr:Gfo/Idh/MocA family oxidoreductase [Streptomyces sp. MA5143a]SPF04002.1 putative UDP-kanosamine synthase oxidoreductase subunit [Streptomyces sp. MA5143a]
MSVRVAVVGLGWAGRTIWLPRLDAHPAFRLTAVVEPDPADEHRTYGVPVLADVDDLTPDLADLAVVAVPNHAHAPVAEKLLRKGIPVFLEKPVCLTTGEADRLAEAERAGGAVLLAGSAACHRADIQALRSVVDSLGEIRHVNLSWVRARGVPGGRGWFTRRALSGGGVLVDLGWHLLDTLALLLGPVTFEQVGATVSADHVSGRTWQAGWRGDEPDGAAPGHDGVPGGDVEDTVRAFLVTEGGVSVSLHTCWASHAPVDVTTVEVHGSAGTAELRCTFGFSPNRVPAPVLTLTRGGESSTVPLPDEPLGTEYDRQVDALPGQLRDPAAPGRGGRAARHTIGLVERIYASARGVTPGPAGSERSPEEVAWREPTWTAR